MAEVPQHQSRRVGLGSFTREQIEAFTVGLLALVNKSLSKHNTNITFRLPYSTNRAKGSEEHFIDRLYERGNSIECLERVKELMLAVTTTHFDQLRNIAFEREKTARVLFVGRQESIGLSYRIYDSGDVVFHLRTFFERKVMRNPRIRSHFIYF